MKFSSQVIASICMCMVSVGCGDDTGGTGTGGGSSPDGVGVDGDVVGGPCSATEGCAASSECIDDGAFPGGTCVVTCESQSDCPEGSFCISSEGGVCLLGCETQDDCREDYICEGKSREDGDGEAKVCA